MNIIELAREAGFSVKNFKPPVITAQHSNGSWIGIDDELEAFATLVRAAALEEAAGVCDAQDMESFGVLPIRAVMITNACAAAIRQLKEAP